MTHLCALFIKCSNKGHERKAGGQRVCPGLQTAGFLPSQNFQVKADKKPMHCACQSLNTLKPETFERVKEKEQYR